MTTRGAIITLDMGDFYLLTVYTPNAQRELTRLDLSDAMGGRVPGRYLKELEAKQARGVLR